MSRRRRRLLGTAALAVTVALCVWAYDRAISPRRWLPGTYAFTRLDGEKMGLRLAADGSAVIECPGAAWPAAPSTQVVGRWRLAGRVLSVETGAKAAAPVGAGQRLSERFESAFEGPELTRARVVSADAIGLTLELGGKTCRLERTGSDAEPGAAADGGGV